MKLSSYDDIKLCFLLPGDCSTVPVLTPVDNRRRCTVARAFDPDAKPCARPHELDDRVVPTCGERRFHPQTCSAKRDSEVPLEHRVEHTRQNFFQSGSLSDRVMLCRSELERLAREIARKRSRYQHDFYEDVRASIARHVFDPEISLQMIADEIEKSEYHLSRIMPQVVGENFKSYIDRTRMELARRRLLEAPDEPVKSIMYECGYRQFNTFDRAFRRIYGVSPSEFRRQNRSWTP